MPKMIPIVSISNFITFLVSLFITLYLWRAYIKKREERLKYFLYFFISISLLFLSISVPFLIFKTISFITFSVIMMPSFLYLTLTFISLISLRILKWHKLEKIYLIILLLSLVFSYSMIFINFEPVQITTFGDFIYWTIPSSRTFWQIGSVVNGIISGMTLLSVAIFFFISGFKSEEKFIRKRAFLMSIGMISLTLAGIINFIIGGIPSFSAHIVAALISVFGLLTFFGGIVMIKTTKLTLNKTLN